MNQPTPPPIPLGARLDYSARIAVRTADGLPDGGTVALELEGGPLTLRRMGAAFHVAAPGQPDRALPADDLPAFVWAAVLEHVKSRSAAAASHRRGADSVKAA